MIKNTKARALIATLAIIMALFAGGSTAFGSDVTVANGTCQPYTLNGVEGQLCPNPDGNDLFYPATVDDPDCVPIPEDFVSDTTYLLCKLSDGTVGMVPRHFDNGNGGIDEPTTVQTTDTFQPAMCEGDLRFDEGLARGFAGPTTDEMMEALRLRKDNVAAPPDFLVRMGESCALWHAGLGSIAPFSTVLPSEVAGFRNFLYQVGIVGEDFERIMTSSEGRRIRNIRQLVIYWAGDPNGQHTYPEGTWVYNCDEALSVSNDWGSTDVDNPSFQYVLDSCGGNVPTNSVIHTSSMDDGNGDNVNTSNPSSGGQKGDCSKADVSRATGIPKDQLKATEYAWGWNWPADPSHRARNFNVEELGYYMIDSPNGKGLKSGNTGLVKGATFWCHK